MKHLKRHLLRTVLPWTVTAVAIYLLVQGVEWERVVTYLKTADLRYLALSVLFTLLSYAGRARRWESLFPRPVIRYLDSFQVLVLGFFMNNVLPARTGELVRAHLGAKVTRESRTLVLATIASERLADGLTISGFFLLVSLRPKNHQYEEYSQSLFYVACAFAAVSVGVVIALAARNVIFGFIDRFNESRQSKSIDYVSHRAKLFLDGLAPLLAWPGVLVIALWSIVIWSVELMTYFSISRAFGQELPLSLCVLFMVALNFSSLIPAAPGGIGVIEAVTTAVLVSVDIEYEKAMTMVLTQHVLQFIIIGILGLLFLSTWKKSIKDSVEAIEVEDDLSPV